VCNHLEMGGTKKFADQIKTPKWASTVKQYHYMNLIIENSECYGPNFEIIKHVLLFKEFFM